MRMFMLKPLKVYAKAHAHAPAHKLSPSLVFLCLCLSVSLSHLFSLFLSLHTSVFMIIYILFCYGREYETSIFASNVS